MTSLHKELISILLVRLVTISRGYYTGPNETNFLQHSFMVSLYKETFFSFKQQEQMCKTVL